MINQNNTIVENALAYVKEFFSNDFSGNDYHHTIRVFNTATKLAREENADIEIVQLSALLHDVDDKKISPGTALNKDNAKGFLAKNGVDNEKITLICEIIDEISFSKNGLRSPRTIEGKCVQDADRLDAIGAIGIARAFAFGGSHERPIHDPENVENSNSSVAHFYDKLFKLKDSMNTDAAKQIALERDEFMRDYIKELFDEWDGIK